MMQDQLKEIEYIKACKGLPGTKLEHLGRSTYDKIANIISDPDNILTHLHIPPGTKEAAGMLESRFEAIFNTSINPELLSFFHCFNGFELRYVNPKKAWREIDRSAIDIDPDEVNADLASLEYDELFTEEHEAIKFAFFDHLNYTENQTSVDRLSDPKYPNDFLFYGDNIEQEDYGVKTLIPPADFFLSESNKVEDYGSDDAALFYFNFHASFRQRVYGKRNGALGVYIATDGAADITKDQGDDMRLYFKKYLIRNG